MLYMPPPSLGSFDDFMDIEPDVTTSRQLSTDLDDLLL
jgi:hypothetical protein